MKCLYCNKKCNNNEIFCSGCGQPFVENQILSEVDSYWKEVNELSAKEDIRQKAEEQKIIEETNEQRKKLRYRIIFMCIAVIATICLIGWRNSVNTQILETIQKNILGQTYSDEKGMGHFSGEEYECIMVNIIDEEQLEYTHGEYVDVVSESSSGYNMTKKESQIYKRRTYAYELSISFFGNVTIKINGKDYKVTLNDDNTISHIYFYED